MSEELTAMETAEQGTPFLDEGGERSCLSFAGDDAHIVPSEDPADLEVGEGVCGSYGQHNTDGCVQTTETRGLPSRPEQGDEAMIDRLAEEYLALCAELPTVGAFDALPPSVLAQAASGKSLAEAYYRHAYLEKCRVEDERQRQAAARAAATGSLAGEAVTGVTSAEAAMLRGIWGERL